ncbi:MAG: hypothetical protein P8Z30_08430 [Acidobacteriota bacterium]
MLEVVCRAFKLSYEKVFHRLEWIVPFYPSCLAQAERRFVCPTSPNLCEIRAPQAGNGGSVSWSAAPDFKMLKVSAKCRKLIIFYELMPREGRFSTSFSTKLLKTFMVGINGLSKAALFGQIPTQACSHQHDCTRVCLTGYKSVITLSGEGCVWSPVAYC